MQGPADSPYAASLLSQPCFEQICTFATSNLLHGCLASSPCQQPPIRINATVPAYPSSRSTNDSYQAHSDNLITNLATGRNILPLPRPPTNLPLQTPNRHLHNQNLPPKHQQRHPPKLRRNVPRHAQSRRMETLHKDGRSPRIHQTTVERSVSSALLSSPLLSKFGPVHSPSKPASQLIFPPPF